jgi:hypothetical protein
MEHMFNFHGFKRVIAVTIFSLGLVLFYPAGISLTHAQTASSPTFLVTWKAINSYVPSFYRGKALPSYGSKITASLELISNGKVIDISGQTIYWYLNEVLVGGGTGVQQVTFSPFGLPPNSLTLNVELPQYNGQYLTHSIQIPLVSPVSVIYAPYPNNTFSTNPITLNALPYFFNTASAADLSYSWSVNGQTGTNTESPQEAQITLPQGTPSGTSVAVSLSITNPVGSTVATANQSLTYQSQL